MGNAKDTTLDEIATTSELSISATERARIDFGALSHPGRVRRNNEDQFAVLRRRRIREVLLTSLPGERLPQTEDDAYTLMVADGMGGAAFGEVASELALRTAWELGARDEPWPLPLRAQRSEQLQKESGECVRLIHHRLQQRVRKQPELAGMGTTLTAVYCTGWTAYVVHVGDSRAYLIRDAAAQLITRDHTLAQQMMDAGVDQARTTDYQHVLTNCLGGDASEVISDFHQLGLQDGDQLLLCTDGLSDLVHATEMHYAVRHTETPQDACQWLVDRALERGGKDNITVLVARFRLPEDPEA